MSPSDMSILFADIARLMIRSILLLNDRSNVSNCDVLRELHCATSSLVLRVSVFKRMLRETERFVNRDDLETELYARRVLSNVSRCLTADIRNDVARTRYIRAYHRKLYTGTPSYRDDVATTIPTYGNDDGERTSRPPQPPQRCYQKDRESRLPNQVRQPGSRIARYGGPRISMKTLCEHKACCTRSLMLDILQQD